MTKRRGKSRSARRAGGAGARVAGRGARVKHRGHVSIYCGIWPIILQSAIIRKYYLTIF